jgi:hypothetical protein
MKSLVVLSLLVFGCAAANTPTGNDGSTGGHAICPDHPDQCGGKCCGNKCIDTTLDPNNCGDCGNACGAGQLCRSGSCGCLPSGAMCGTGQTCCSSAGCKSLMSDVNNCGACGNACGTGGSCTNGMCTCGGMTCGANQKCCSGTCMSSCATDMGMPDMSTSGGGLCQCSDHCVGDPVGWCVGTNCCYANGIFMTCMIGPCQINMAP